MRVGSDQRKFFFDALRNQDAVEWVAVMRFQASILRMWSRVTGRISIRFSAACLIK